MTVEEEDPMEVGGAPESVSWKNQDLGGLEEVGPLGLEELEFPELEKDPEPPESDAPEINDAIGEPGNM